MGIVKNWIFFHNLNSKVMLCDTQDVAAGIASFFGNPQEISSEALIEVPTQFQKKYLQKIAQNIFSEVFERFL